MSDDGVWFDSRAWIVTACPTEAGRAVVSRRALIRRGKVAVAMNDLPFAVLPAEHVGDARHVLPGGATVDGEQGALEADRVGQVTAAAGGLRGPGGSR